MKRSFPYGIELEDLEAGILVRQYNEAYIARGWKLTERVVLLVETALDSGMRWMIRRGHPQVHARWPTGNGRVYLAFSPTPENQWSLATDSFDKRRGDFGNVVFNGKYVTQFRAREIPFEFEKRNRKSGHLVVARQEVFNVLRSLKTMDHSVLHSSNRSDDRPGFSTEYDIQRAMMFAWHQTPFGMEEMELIGDEVPVDDGPNPRRIDLLARDKVGDNVLIIEVKRAEAPLSAVNQVLGYIDALTARRDFSSASIRGAIVAERIPEPVRDAAQANGVVTFEICWPLTFNQVTSEKILMAKETSGSKFKHYSDRDIDTIAGSLPGLDPAADMNIGAELNELAEHYFILKRWQNQPPPSKQRDELEAISHAAERLLKKLEVSGADIASQQSADILHMRLRAAADSAGEAEGGYPDLPPRFFEIDGEKYPDYRGDEALAASVLGIRRIVYWSNSAAKIREREVQKNHRERRAADEALEVFMFRLANLYEALSGRQPGVSRPQAGGEPGGPWLRFLNACLVPIGLDFSANALDARWRRMKKARDHANRAAAAGFLEEP